MKRARATTLTSCKHAGAGAVSVSHERCGPLSNVDRMSEWPSKHGGTWSARWRDARDIQARISCVGARGLQPLGPLQARPHWLELRARGISEHAGARRQRPGGLRKTKTNQQTNHVLNYKTNLRLGMALGAHLHSGSSQ